MGYSCYDQYTVKIVLTLILVSLYIITLATRIKNGTLFIFSSWSCAIENINNNKKNFKRFILCLCEEMII